MIQVLYSHHIVYKSEYQSNLDMDFSAKERIKVSFPNISVAFPKSGPADEAIINLDVNVDTKINESNFRKLTFSVRFFFNIKGEVDQVDETVVIKNGYDIVMSITQSLIKSISEIGGNIPIIVNDLHPSWSKEST